MLKAVIMDFDGVIIDTETVWYHIFAEWFQAHKQYELNAEEFLSCVGSDSYALFDRLAAQGIHVDQDQFRSDTREAFVQRSAALPLIDGVADFIQRVKDAGLLLALATSAARPKPIMHLTRFGLLGDFDQLVTSELVERIKPHPDLFQKAAELLGIAPGEALVVEDSQNGLLAANRAGMPVLVVPNDITRRETFQGHFTLLDSLANMTVEDLRTYHRRLTESK